MFTILKWYLLLQIWASSKSTILVLVALWILYIFANHFFKDLIVITQQESIPDLIYFKWVFISVLLIATCFLIYKIYCDVLSDLGMQESESNEKVEAISRKKVMLSKPTLKSRSEMIIEKYQRVK